MLQKVLLLSAFLLGASIADELLTTQVETDSALQEQRIQATLQATIANAKMESNQKMSQLKEDKQNKLKLLDQVAKLQAEKLEALEKSTQLEQQLKTSHAELEKTTQSFDAAKQLIEKQKQSMILIEEKNAKEKQTFKEAGDKVQQMIRKEMTQKNVNEESFLDEGVGVNAPQMLVDNVKKSLASLHAQRIQVENKALITSAAAARQQHIEDIRTAEEKDQADLAASLDHLDDSKPLMEQLGLE